jgi:hypothetical protein
VWSGPHDDIHELRAVSTGQVADRERVSYRMGVHRDGKEYVVEQQAYYSSDGSCSITRDPNALLGISTRRPGRSRALAGQSRRCISPTAPGSRTTTTASATSTSMLPPSRTSVTKKAKRSSQRKERPKSVLWAQSWSFLSTPEHQMPKYMYIHDP